MFVFKIYCVLLRIEFYKKNIEMNNRPYFQLTNEQLDKIGNTMVFLSKAIPNLSKTKVLKLLYVLDELAISRNGVPFFNLQYKVWKLGPITESIFIELSDKFSLSWLAQYIGTEIDNDSTYIYPKVDFCDDEFSDNDIELLEMVADKFKHTTAKELIDYTHRPNGLWHTTAKENGLLEYLENGTINSTDILIDMSSLVRHDERKRSIYEHYIEEN